MSYRETVRAYGVVLLKKKFYWDSSIPGKTAIIIMLNSACYYRKQMYSG